MIPTPLPEVDPIHGEFEWTVERVLDHEDVKVSQKSRRTQRKFLVKWKGYPMEDNEWVKESHCQCPDLVQEYHNSLR